LILAAAFALGVSPGCTSAPPTARAADQSLSIVRVYTGWRDGASFKRIAEYFAGKEHPGREIVRRSHPDQRTGYYFLVRVKNPGGAQAVQFELQWIEQGVAAARTAVFPAELPAGAGVFQLGLTGPGWQDATKQPMAWRLEIHAADGQVLAAEQSYLWEKPTTE